MTDFFESSLAGGMPDDVLGKALAEYEYDGERLRFIVHGRGMFQVSHTVPDSYGSGEEVTVSAAGYTDADIKPNTPEMDVCVRKALMRLAVHEVDEMLKRNGELVANPHAYGYLEPQLHVAPPRKLHEVKKGE